MSKNGSVLAPGCAILRFVEINVDFEWLWIQFCIGILPLLCDLECLQ
jgi:hypothetical protein